MFGDKDGTHATFPNLFHEAIATNGCAGGFANGGAVDGGVGFLGTGLEEVLFFLVNFQKGLDTASEVDIAPTDLPEILGSQWCLINLPGGVEDGFFVELLVGHG